MKRPRTLKGHAKEFWDTNAPILIADGRLTDCTLYGFVGLCQSWDDYQSGREKGIDANKVVALSKQVQQQLAAYGMTPASRKKLRLEKAESIAEVIERKIGFGADAE